MTTLARLPHVAVRLEGLAVFAGALALYFDAGYGWLALVVLALAPDLSLAGYLAGTRAGALSYNVFHSYVLPLGLGVVGALASAELVSQLALIWIAHIGADRLLGYGLKYPDAFRPTHVQRI